MLEFKKPIPIILKETGQEGYAIYATDSKMFENDVWCIALCKGGDIISVTVDQIKVHCNKTFGIEK